MRFGRKQAQITAAAESGPDFRRYDHGAQRWIEDIWSALKRLAESDLGDFSFLRSARRSLCGADVEAWDALTKELVSQTAALRRQRLPDSAIFCALVAQLNEQWLIPRELLLMRRGESESPRDLWDREHQPDRGAAAA